VEQELAVARPQPVDEIQGRGRGDHALDHR
jgi:hypothetical protein